MRRESLWPIGGILQSIGATPQGSGLQKGDRVCFLIPKSPAAYISMLGILKADCVHVPLDTSSPAPRLARIVESCEPRFILGAGPVANLLGELMSDDRFRSSVSIGWMGADAAAGRNFEVRFSWGDLESYSRAPLDYQNTREDPAHILFTSGSTGTPKGVVITHSNVIHFIEWANRYFGICSSDRLSAHPPLHFDLSTFDMFGAFAAGAELHLVSPALNLLPHKLADFIRASELTQWFSVPSILSYMAKFDVVSFNDFPTLKRVLWCGEVFPTPPLIYWMKRLPKVSFTNLYGPTEATIASSYYTVPKCPEDERAAIPIGTPVRWRRAYGARRRSAAGSARRDRESVYSRSGVKPRILRDREKTDAVFLPNPQSSEPGDRIYKTGDLARIGRRPGLFPGAGRLSNQESRVSDRVGRDRVRLERHRWIGRVRGRGCQQRYSKARRSAAPMRLRQASRLLRAFCGKS